MLVFTKQPPGCNMHTEACLVVVRQDRPPLPLPHLKASKRIVLVRHGQSTWNAEGRIQGSTDFSILTPKGEAQAETTRQMVIGTCA